MEKIWDRTEWNVKIIKSSNERWITKKKKKNGNEILFHSINDIRYRVGQDDRGDKNSSVC